MMPVILVLPSADQSLAILVPWVATHWCPEVVRCFSQPVEFPKGSIFAAERELAMLAQCGGVVARSEVSIAREYRQAKVIDMAAQGGSLRLRNRRKRL